MSDTLGVVMHLCDRAAVKQQGLDCRHQPSLALVDGSEVHAYTRSLVEVTAASAAWRHDLALAGRADRVRLVPVAAKVRHWHFFLRGAQQ